MQLDSVLWDYVSEPAKDLIRQMLQVDPSKRLTIQEVLNHRWLRDRDKSSTRVHLADCVEQLRRFNSRRKLKSAVRQAVASPRWDITGMNNCDAMSDGGYGAYGYGYGADDEVSYQAVNQVLDSLDDIPSLQEPLSHDQEILAKLLDDRQLHALLEVSPQNSHTY